MSQTVMTFERAAGLLTTPAAAGTLVHSPDDVEQLLGVSYTPDQRRTLANIPFSEETLRACAGKSVFFPGFPDNLLDLRSRKPDLFYERSGGWYAEERQRFARLTVPASWYLLQIVPDSISFGKDADTQVLQLGAGETVPSTSVVAFAAVLHMLAAKTRLFGGSWVRTADKTAGDLWVSLRWLHDKLHIDDWCGHVHEGGAVGLASLRTC